MLSLVLIMLTLGRWRQEGQEFKTSLEYMSLCLGDGVLGRLRTLLSVISPARINKGGSRLYFSWRGQGTPVRLGSMSCERLQTCDNYCDPHLQIRKLRSPDVTLHMVRELTGLGFEARC